MKKALVIGGSGYLGRHLLEELMRQDVEVFAIRHNNPVEGIAVNHQISGGIRSVDSKLVDEIMPDILFHLARPVIPKLKRWGRKWAAHKAARLNKNLLRQLQQSSTKPLLVFASGSLMYGNSKNPHFEESPINPVSFARQYYKGEIPVIESAKKKEYPIQVFRLPWLLGNGSWFKWFYLENIRKSKSIPKFGHAKNGMEIIDVRDAAKLMVNAAFENKARGIINIPSAGAISQQQFLEKTAEVFDAQIVDFSRLYPGKVENAVIEAYTSNIVLASKYPELFKEFEFSDLETSLRLLGKMI